MDSKTRLTDIQGKFKTQKNLKEQLASDIKDRQTKLNELVSTYNELKAQIASQLLELSEREATIRDKEKRIHDLKKKTQELEKFKFVLDYKIKELKRDIGPRGATIEKLKEQTNKMHQEQLHFRRVFENLGLIVADLKMRMSGLKRELQKLMEVLEKQAEEKKYFMDQVHDSLNNIGDYKKLKKSIIKLYKLYVTEEEKNKKSDDNDSSLEFQKIRKNLQQNVNHLRSALTKADESHDEVNKRFMKQNVELISQINSLKQELHNYKKNINTIKSSQENQQAQQEWAQASIEERELKIQDHEINKLLEAIAHEQAVNQQLKERKPQRLAPLVQRDGSQDDVQKQPSYDMMDGIEVSDDMQ